MTTKLSERPALSVAAHEVPMGRFLCGEFMGVRPGRGFEKRDGTMAEPWDVGLNVGGDVVAVQFRDRATAELVAGSFAKGERIMVRVEVRNGVTKDGRPWLFYGEPWDGGNGDAGGWE